MSHRPPSLAALASAGRPLPVRITNSYNTSAVIVVDTNRVHEIGSGPRSNPCLTAAAPQE